nr:MAG TPA: hypothetical protein [Caudoviricetes sp.]
MRRTTTRKKTTTRTKKITENRGGGFRKGSPFLVSVSTNTHQFRERMIVQYMMRTGLAIIGI